MKLLGLDGCEQNAWVVAESDSEFKKVEFRVVSDLKPLFDEAARGEVMAVLDVPIGLTAESRRCDAEARTLLGPRHVCVFTPPGRATLDASTFDEATHLNQLHCQRGLTRQGFGILPRVKAVDDLITPEHQSQISEGHPEVAFAVLNERRPLTHAKDTRGGVQERMALLEAAGVPPFDPAAERRLLRPAPVDVDDVVDAAIMLVAARDAATREGSQLPHGGGDRDERGLLMEMWMPASLAVQEIEEEPSHFRFTKSKSGVRLYDDFRDNLIIDRYHPNLASMRGSKRDRLRSENSEDALTWNVFRSLVQIDPAFWWPRLHAKAFPNTPPPPTPHTVTTRLWIKVSTPPALRTAEGVSEIDITIETEVSVWFIEAKFKSDISTETSHGPERNQIVRNVDVGSWYAGTRDFYFSLLITDETRSPKGVEILNQLGPRVPTLAHRPEGMKNVKGIGSLRWRDVADVLLDAAERAPRADERGYAAKAVEWMKKCGVC
jgi:predicted RNase H-like nuclease